MPKKSTVQRILWNTQVQRIRFWDHLDGRRLGVVVQNKRPGVFAAMALEAKDPSSAQSVLDSHAHHLLGQNYRTETTAMRAGETFARRWLKTHSMLAACGCPKRSPKRKSEGS